MLVLFYNETCIACPGRSLSITPAVENAGPNTTQEVQEFLELWTVDTPRHED